MSTCTTVGLSRTRLSRSSIEKRAGYVTERGSHTPPQTLVLPPFRRASWCRQIADVQRECMRDMTAQLDDTLPVDAVAHEWWNVTAGLRLCKPGGAGTRQFKKRGRTPSSSGRQWDTPQPNVRLPSADSTQEQQAMVKSRTTKVHGPADKRTKSVAHDLHSRDIYKRHNKKIPGAPRPPSQSRGQPVMWRMGCASSGHPAPRRRAPRQPPPPPPPLPQPAAGRRH